MTTLANGSVGGKARRFRRFNIEYPVLVQYQTGGTTADVEAVTKNISIGGILITSAIVIPLHTPVRSRIWAGEGKIVRVEPTENKGKVAIAVECDVPITHLEETLTSHPDVYNEPFYPSEYLHSIRFQSPNRGPSPTCSVCSSPMNTDLRDVRDAVTGDRFDILRCPQCGLGQTVPQPKDLSRYYREYHGNRHPFTARYCDHRRLRLVRKAAGPARGRRLLDIGCGPGTFLRAVKGEGWDVVGTEMNPEPPRQFGLEVVSDIGELPAGKKFDCVTLWHSLEHLPEPRSTLQRVRQLLASDGVLMIAVPDFGGLQATIFGKEWLHLDVPRHLFHFDRRALSNLLTTSGFTPVRWSHQEFEYDLMGWSQSALNKVSRPSNFFFNMLTGRTLNSGVSKRALQWLAGSLLCATAIPVVPLSSFVGRGGTLVVAARPCRDTKRVTAIDTSLAEAS